MSTARERRSGNSTELRPVRFLCDGQQLEKGNKLLVDSPPSYVPDSGRLEDSPPVLTQNLVPFCSDERFS